MIPLFAGLFGAGLLLGGNVAERDFERSAAHDIADKLSGEQKQVRVNARLDYRSVVGDLPSVTIQASHFSSEALPLFTEPERSTRGHVRRLRLDMTDFRLGTLRVERLSARIPECRFDFDFALRHRKIRLSRSGVGDGVVVLRAEDIAAFIERKIPEITQTKVTIHAGRVRVEGRAQILVIVANFVVDARLEPREGDKLFLVDPHIQINGRESEARLRDTLVEKFNPVIDLNRDLKLYGAVEMTDVQPGEGTVTIKGRFHIPIRPAP